MTKSLNEIKILLRALVLLILLLNVVLIIQLFKNAGSVNEVYAKSYKEPTKVDIVRVGGSPVYSFKGIPVDVRGTKK